MKSIMVNQTKWKLVIIIGLYWFSVSNVQSQTEHEIKIQEMLSSAGDLTEEQKNQMRLQVESIISTRNHFDYKAIKQPCIVEIERFCSGEIKVHEKLTCIELNRNKVSRICEASLKTIFGGIPFSENKLHAGVLLPKGSYFFYDRRENILGAVVSENFVYKEIEFKKGQVRFHKIGLSVAHLVHDQIIDDILFKANGIGPFFNKEGNVINATLGEDTEIAGIVYKAGSQIMFRCIGKVEFGLLAKNVLIGGVSYQAGNTLSFKRNGKIVTYK